MSRFDKAVEARVTELVLSAAILAVQGADNQQIRKHILTELRPLTEWCSTHKEGCIWALTHNSMHSKCDLMVRQMHDAHAEVARLKELQKG